MSVRQAIALLVISVSLEGCHLFKPPPRPSAEGDLPKTFSYLTRDSHRSQRWWEDFGASELNALVEECLTSSFSLKEAWSRLHGAQAAQIQAGANLFPGLSADGSASYSRQGVKNGSRGIMNSKDYSLGLFSSYEIDFWGRIRSERKAVRLETRATRQDVSTAAMTLAARITEHWARTIWQRAQKELLLRQLETNHIFLDLVELRFRKAMVSALDVYQQKQVVEQIKAEIPLVEAQEQLERHELALLLGRPPKTNLAVQSKVLPLIGNLPAVGLPADLLARRPDLLAAYLRLQAADWQVAAARANRLPSMNLTAGAGYGAGALDLLFDNWLLSLAGDLSAPILDGKRRAAEVEKVRSQADGRLWSYRQTVMTAIKEVEDALISESKRREHIAGLEQSIDVAQRALEQAGERYRKGLNDYLPVLNQLLSVQRLERDMLQQQLLLLVDRVNLYRALGGTWTEGLTEPLTLNTDDKETDNGH